MKTAESKFSILRAASKATVAGLAVVAVGGYGAKAAAADTHAKIVEKQGAISTTTSPGGLPEKAPKKRTSPAEHTTTNRPRAKSSGVPDVVNLKVRLPESGKPDFSHLNINANLCKYEPLKLLVAQEFGVTTKKLYPCKASNVGGHGGPVEKQYVFSTPSPNPMYRGPENDYVLGILVVDESDEQVPLDGVVESADASTDPFVGMLGQTCVVGWGGDQVACTLGDKAIVDVIDNFGLREGTRGMSTPETQWVIDYSMKALGAKNVK